MFKKSKPSFPERIPRRLAELNPKAKKSSNKKRILGSSTAIGVGSAIVVILMDRRKAKKA